MTATEIKEAIAKLPHEEFWQFAEWFDDHKSDRWDQQIQEDAQAGRLDHLVRKADEDIVAGRCTPL